MNKVFFVESFDILDSQNLFTKEDKYFFVHFSCISTFKLSEPEIRRTSYVCKIEWKIA